MSHINRRHFLGATAAASAAAVGGFGRLAEAAGVSLTPGVPVASQVRAVGRAARQEAADQARLSAAELRDADRVFPHADHAERRSSSCAITCRTSRRSTPRPGRLRSAARAPTATPNSRSTISRRCRPSRSSPSTSARATGAGCSNRMSPGVEWGYGAMGNARWKGARLKDVLDKVGLKKEAIEIAFNGADGPAVDKTPDFIKSIPVWKAIDETTLVAYEMNGAPLPHFNGFPARIVVPGWTGTYWMKHVVSIEALTKPRTNFWMNPAYRIPLGKFPLVERFITQETAANTPITEMVVNSLITSHRDGAKVKAGKRHGRRHRLGRRLRHPHGRSLDRRRQELARRDARRGSRPLRVPRLELRARRQARQATR